MEVALSAPQMLSEPLRRGTPLPLNRLLEESRDKANLPNHLLQSKIYATLKGNSLIQAEPPELHFSGFKLGTDYIKHLKLINVSSEVMNIHIIPTQTKHFQTSYTKKYRLIPGLAYTLKVRFCPDEWRYFYDCVRVHCKGEENLLVPVHAYPVIDDLHIPPHIDLSAVPLGQSVCHAIPLRCSCPVDFEFQVHVIQPHRAFSIHPLTGVIPAGGEVNISVTFTPAEYETSQVTLQLTVSQFNTRPYLCTVTGSCAPGLGLSDLGAKPGHVDALPAEDRRPVSQVPPRSKNKHRSRKDADKSKRESGSGPVDVFTPAGVAKMLIKDTSKLSSKDLREALSCGSMAALRSRRLKEAVFMKKVRQSVAQQAGHARWQVHLGKDPVSEQTRRAVAEEREISLHEYMVKRGDVRHEGDFAAGKPQLSSKRLLCEAGQACEGAPCFQHHPSLNWELRTRVFALFQQAARKVVIRCRMARRLSRLKALADSVEKSPPAHRAEEAPTCELQISPDRVFPSAFPVFRDEDDPLPPGNLVTVPVDPVDVTVTTHIPFFKLRVPQHYQLMGYQPVPVWEAFSSYIPIDLARPLRTGAPDAPGARPPLRAEPETREEDEPEVAEDSKARERLSFRLPEALLRPRPANPLHIFNPALDLQAYKPKPKYLETDLEFHLCPLPRYTIPETFGNKIHTQMKFLDRKEVIRGLVTWKSFDAITSSCPLSRAALSSQHTASRSVHYSQDTLPATAPPPLPGPPSDPAALMDTQCEGSGVRLTPDMIRAQFMSAEALVSNSNLTGGTTGRFELQEEATRSSQFNQMGRRVMERLRQLGDTETSSQSPAEDCE